MSLDPPTVDPFEADDGQPIYHALVKPIGDGSFLLSIVARDADDDEGRLWVWERFMGPDARALLLRLDAIARAGRA